MCQPVTAKLRALTFRHGHTVSLKSTIGAHFLLQALCAACIPHGICKLVHCCTIHGFRCSSMCQQGHQGFQHPGMEHSVCADAQDLPSGPGYSRLWSLGSCMLVQCSCQSLLGLQHFGNLLLMSLLDKLLPASRDNLY